MVLEAFSIEPTTLSPLSPTRPRITASQLLSHQVAMRSRRHGLRDMSHSVLLLQDSWRLAADKAVAVSTLSMLFRSQDIASKPQIHTAAHHKPELNPSRSCGRKACATPNTKRDHRCLQHGLVLTTRWAASYRDEVGLYN